MLKRTRKITENSEKLEIGEYFLLKRIITEVYPNGIISYVSDTYNLWSLCTKVLPKLKKEILARNGKVVIRPDSGDPVDILCGNNKKKEFQKMLSNVSFSTVPPPINDKPETPEEKGVVELLWDVFGGTINEKGYKVLDPHIGAIYGDSITLDRCEEINARLEAKGFASQVVLGIGSYTYQYNTRDTFGQAVKSTYVEINNECREIFKDPITDDGMKKSARGLIRVDLENGEYVLKDRQTWETEGGELKTVFRDGLLVRDYTLQDIRDILWNKTQN